MTTHPQQQTPPRCRYDRTLGERVTRHHGDHCPDPDTCRGCQPCLEAHCRVCGREHLDDTHPRTCPACVAGVRNDLGAITQLTRGLRDQAATAEGYTWAAARIPGATAMVLVGPSVTADQLRAGRHYADDRHGDPVPPLAVLAHWEDTWRTWLGQPPAGRATVAGAVAYLDEQLTMIAQTGMRLDEHDQVQRPPEFPEFSRTIAQLRAQLERVLHDEQEPDRGVECFECGARLVRRHRDRRRCHHTTPARQWLAVLLSYPELRVYPTELAAARAACDRCDQGGLADPTPGVSWECPSCRMSYSPGEYATAVRRDLLESQAPQGWTNIPMAQAAVSTIVGKPVPMGTIRRWMDRGQVTSLCTWTPGKAWGERLVFWPDVATLATRSTRRIGRAS